MHPSAPLANFCGSTHPIPAGFTPPAGYPRVKIVGSFLELLETPFGDGVNALCWPRVLTDGFAEIISRLTLQEDITNLEEDNLRGLEVGPAGRAAIEFVLEDLRLLREQDLAPVLNCIKAYERDLEGVVPTDVYSFHADSATVPADTWLCTYHGAPSEGLRNDQAERCVDAPDLRARLLKRFGGPDKDEFQAYLAENCYDLHYRPVPGAQPFSFGLGNLWRIAVDYPGSPVPPCVHRAPDNLPGHPPRLMLIS